MKNRLTQLLGNSIPVLDSYTRSALKQKTMIKLSLVVFLMFLGITIQAQTITIGSQAGSSNYNIVGIRAADTRAKLTNPANFGPSGTYCNFTFVTTSIPDPITEAAINAAGIDIWWSGFEADATYTAAELTELQNWINNGGVVIAGCDSALADPVCSILGLTLTGQTPSGTSSIVDSSCFPNTTTTILNGGGAVASFSGIAGLNIITNQDQLGGPSGVFGQGIVALTDINMITNDGCCLSPGSAITNSNDFFLADVMCLLAEESQGTTTCLNGSCGAGTDAPKFN